MWLFQFNVAVSKMEPLPVARRGTFRFQNAITLLFSDWLCNCVLKRASLDWLGGVNGRGFGSVSEILVNKGKGADWQDFFVYL